MSENLQYNFVSGFIVPQRPDNVNNFLKYFLNSPGADFSVGNYTRIGRTTMVMPLL